MKSKLGFICSADFGDRARIPKDFWEEQEKRIYSKYIVFYDNLTIGEWFKATNYLPEFILFQEVPIWQVEDLEVIGRVNIFLREKIEENVIKFQPKVAYLEPEYKIGF